MAGAIAGPVGASDLMRVPIAQVDDWLRNGGAASLKGRAQGYASGVLSVGGGDSKQAMRVTTAANDLVAGLEGAMAQLRGSAVEGATIAEAAAQPGARLTLGEPLLALETAAVGVAHLDQVLSGRGLADGVIEAGSDPAQLRRIIQIADDQIAPVRPQLDLARIRGAGDDPAIRGVAGRARVFEFEKARAEAVLARQGG